VRGCSDWKVEEEVSEAKPVFYMKAYLWAEGYSWSEEQVDELLSRFADFLVEQGFGNPEDEDEAISSIVIAGQEERPDNPEEFAFDLVNQEGVVLVILPGLGE
jgi:hypothetical protein